MSEEENKKLYSIKELILWLEDPRHQWSFNRPAMYAKYARKELEAVRHRMQLTIVAVGGLCGLAGFFIGWSVK